MNVYWRGPVVPEAVDAKPAKKEPKPKVKNDPQREAAARELRDRWVKQVNATPLLGHGKYDVSRAIGQRVEIQAGDLPRFAIEANPRIAA